MIQRIQSILLLLASGSALSLFAEPMSLMEVDNTQGLSADAALADKVFNVHDNIILLVVVVLAGILAFGAIFLYKNRKQQMTLTRLAIIASILIMVLTGIFFAMDFNALTGATNVEVGYGVLSPVLALIFSILALRFIGKDEKLVKSMDRLR